MEEEGALYSVSAIRTYQFLEIVRDCASEELYAEVSTAGKLSLVFYRRDFTSLLWRFRLVEESEGSANQQVSPAIIPTLPVLQKIIDTSYKMKVLKDEHAMVSNQMKEINKCSLEEPEMSRDLHHLSSQLGTLKKQYLEESSAMKRLYNEVIKLKGNMRVFCRCRPLNQAEISNGCASIVEFDLSQEKDLQVLSTDSSKKHFKFDHVFKPEDSQETVFAQTKPIVTSVLDGFNVCIFPYGQTGTGKTFTMEGTLENRGMNYKTLEELFHCSESRSGMMKFELSVSMLEVYNEKIRDLLVDATNQPAKKLEVKQSAEGTQEVPGLVEAQVFDTGEVWDLLKRGYGVRSMGSTAAIEQSSRSHCLLRVTVKGENLINGQRTRSHLWLVDLAGSERVGKIEVEGERLKESSTVLPDLPQDIVELILQRLPPKSLVRYQICCKEWMSLLAEPKFVQESIKFGPKVPGFLHAKDSALWMLDVETNKYFCFCEFQLEHIASLSQCVSEWIDREAFSVYDMYTLGHNMAMCYKVLRFNILGSCDHDDYDNDEPQAELLDLDSGCWKSVAITEDWGVYELKYVPISVENSSYWLADWYFSEIVFLQSFDFNTELFKPIALPNANEVGTKTRTRPRLLLSSFEGNRISLVWQQERENKTVVWVTNKLSDDGDAKWQKLFVVSTKHPSICGSIFIQENKIVIFSERVHDGKSEIKVIKVASEGIEETEIGSFAYATPSVSCVYIPSLLRLQ
ncbi:unnamed protein product [Cochlearia groenlandica]